MYTLINVVHRITHMTHTRTQNDGDVHLQADVPNPERRVLCNHHYMNISMHMDVLVSLIAMYVPG
jgi:hypothetical protein